MLRYNSENLNRVLNSPNTLYFKSCSVGLKCNICSVFSKEPGIYEKVIITEPQNFMLYPLDPLYRLYTENKSKFSEKYIQFNRKYTEIVINKNNLNYIECIYHNNSRKVAILARFNDRSCTIIDIQSKKFFERYILERYKTILGNHSSLRFEESENIWCYPIIEKYIEDNIANIPILQNLKQKTYRRRN